MVSSSCLLFVAEKCHKATNTHPILTRKLPESYPFVLYTAVVTAK